MGNSSSPVFYSQHFIKEKPYRGIILIFGVEAVISILDKRKREIKITSKLFLKPLFYFLILKFSFFKSVG